MDQAGLVKTWKNRHWPLDACAAEVQEMRTTSRVLTIMDLKLAFVALAVGLGFGFCALVIENCIKIMTQMELLLDLCIYCKKNRNKQKYAMQTMS